MSANTPRFSIVVPTRNRHETLASTLRTVVVQDFSDYEIVVSDNCSSAETRRVVDELASARVRYVRSDTPLAMTDSWEFAVRHSLGDYILVLGDDDGLLPGSLRECDRMLRQTGAQLLRVGLVLYWWPSAPQAHTPDLLSIPIGKKVQVENSRGIIGSVLQELSDHHRLPMIYNSFVHRSLLDVLKQKTGRVFHSAQPDVYSGFALAYLTNRLVTSESPLVVRGTSSASTGIGALFLPAGESSSAIEFKDLNKGADIGMSSGIPDLPILSVALADSFLKAKELLFPYDMGLTIDRKQMLRCFIRDLRLRPDAITRWPEYTQALHEYVSNSPDMGRYLSTELDMTALPTDLIADTLRVPSIDTWSLTVDAAAFGVHDVFGASALCEQLLDYRDYDWELKDLTSPVDGPKRLSVFQRIRVAARILLKGN